MLARNTFSKLDDGKKSKILDAAVEEFRATGSGRRA